MKKRFNVAEFGEYIHQHKLTAFNICSDNQPYRDSAEPIRYQLTFPSAVVSTAPNKICLRGETVGSVCLDSVNYVELDDRPTVLGEVFQVHCHNECMAKPRVVTLVVS